MRRHALLPPLLLLLAGCGSGVRTVLIQPVSPAGATSAAGLPCVTFIGDSITEAWPMNNFRHYDGGCYINHGKGGTTMEQILNGIDDRTLPYDASVDPAVSSIAVIGGDIINSLNRGYTVEQIQVWYEGTLTKLQGLHVKPVLCTTLPTANTAFNVETVKLNAWIRLRAAAGNIPLVDSYNTALVQADGSSNPAFFSTDRVHLLASAYNLLTVDVGNALTLARASR